MKTSLVAILAGGLICASAFGQGTVRFSNASADLSSPPDRLVRFAPNGPWTTNNGPVGNFGSTLFRAQLYYGSSTASEGSLIAVTSSPSAFAGSASTAALGTWAPGNRTLLNFFPGNTVNLQVRVWDFSLATSWEAATALGAAYTGLLGTSSVFQYTIPSDPLDIQGLRILNFQSFTIAPVPEPSTIALAGLGVAALLIFRRRK